MADKKRVNKNIVIVGATSAIAEAAALEWATKTSHFFLVARDEKKLTSISNKISVVSKATVTLNIKDCADADSCAILYDARKQLGIIDVILIAYAVYSDSNELEQEELKIQRFIKINFTSQVSWCLAAQKILAEQNEGFLIVLGSPAGDRGRKKNYIYGACKSALERLVEGIDHNLSSGYARAIMLKPGFTRSPMTQNVEKRGFLWSDPNKIARVICSISRSDKTVVYAPKYWRYVMCIIRIIPRCVFNRINI